MRKLLISIVVALALAVAYAAWPVWSAWQLRSAIKARDLAAIERGVDWPTLRANLKQTIAASLAERSRRPQTGYLGKAFQRTLGPFVANRVVDVAVTPGSLARILSGRLGESEMKDGASASGEGEADAAAADPMSPRRLRWAFFEAPTRFRIEVADRREPARRIISVFALQGLGWKLVDVYYRTPS
jgi:hypothetical protein